MFAMISSMFAGRWRYVIAGVSLAFLGVYVLTLHNQIDRQKKSLAAKDTVITELEAANIGFADAIARKDARHAADLQAVRRTHASEAIAVRTEERIKQEVVKNVAEAGPDACGVGILTVIERVREQRAERSISGGGGGKKDTPRTVGVPGTTDAP